MSEILKQGAEAYAFLSRICPKSEAVYGLGRKAVKIQRYDDGEFVVKIFEDIDDKPHDQFVLDATGVVEMAFQYPPLIDVPEAPTAFPADMTNKQSQELAAVRAAKVKEYIETVFQPK